jgi:cold shock CspA family protein
MPTGRVRVFYRSKGYGFIRSEEHGQDIYVSREALQASALKGLRKGQRVEFERAKKRGRFVAIDLRSVHGTRSKQKFVAHQRTFAGQAADTEAVSGSEQEPATKPQTFTPAASTVQGAGSEKRDITDPSGSVVALPEPQGEIGPVLQIADQIDRERRPHSSLDDRTPDQAYFNPLPLRLAA